MCISLTSRNIEAVWSMLEYSTPSLYNLVKFSGDHMPDIYPENEAERELRMEVGFFETNFTWLLFLLAANDVDIIAETS